jgi:hypothetical protein
MNKPHPQANHTRPCKEYIVASTVTERPSSYDDQTKYVDENEPMDLSLKTSVVSSFGRRHYTNVSYPELSFEHPEKPSKHHNQPATIEPEFAHMLIFMENGEQRLITFTLPTESCTVKELLEQVNVPFSADSNIQCILIASTMVDYVISVSKGVLDHSVLVKSAEYVIMQPEVQEHLQTIQELLKCAIKSS